ncbi:FG-GAP repeat domain-containing protein [Actinacidiphila bryophytorum]|uniref:N-acetylmuramoyl-L-alanine amidase n=1 Tax=Actinacidiphila bryophytorum TaxID=1436133 RepID=A0A9W4H4Y8_9ACTN|nr:VCBS repeat-containing protein [Actinacidiphila bryophytorum]MBM9437192.1 VCBS repeat-containing protein [Actinacidiphila bryophytorum]MBN6543248.1 VCBS repeat-containing protein [Actinacidiphila bryophytorum]CAG7650996.1 N-acetylmuramoyl-L-alanine amidase [Actinacidiphila bryophytorum]
MSIGDVRLDANGPAGDLAITLTQSTTTDAFIGLAVNGPHLDQLTFFDNYGFRVPMIKLSSTSALLTVDNDYDADGNGRAGAPLLAGTIHMHVSAKSPVPSLVEVWGSVYDSGSGAVIGTTGKGDYGSIGVRDPLLSTSWYVPDHEPTGTPSVGNVGIPTGDVVVTANALTHKPVPAPPSATHTRWTIPADQISAAQYTPTQLAAALHVDYSPTSDVYTTKHWTTAADGSLTIDLPTHQWVTADSSVTESLHVAVDWGLPAGTLTSVFQSLGDDGTSYAEWDQPLHFSTDIVPAARRAPLYGRDSAGVLWQHQATSNAYSPGTFDPRTRVGGGWNIYNALTALGPLKANGTGDLVARDTAGVLWLYRGTGRTDAPLAARIRISGGWGIYNQLTGAGDITGDGHPDLVARDTAGVLWLYRGTGRTDTPLANRTRICSGWNTYNQILTTGDITGDGHPDLLARDTAGVLWYYPGTGNTTAPYANRIRIGGGWNIYTSIVGIGDMTGDGHQDLVARDSAGKLWYYRGTGNPNAPLDTRTLSGSGMNIYNTLV